MNIPPLLEKLLLSNEAVFKNASLGLSVQNMVFVPAGKTAVILEVSIEPFCNAITTNAMDLFQKGSSSGDLATWNSFIKRIHYQLQIINDKYQTYINLNDSLSVQITPFYTGTAPSAAAYGSLSFNGKREELFIYTDRSLYFNLIYPYKIQEEGPDTPGLSPTYDTPANGFLPKIQNIPPSPTTFYKNNFQDYVVYYDVISTGTDNYYPVNHQSSALYPVNPQMEYLRFFNSVNETTVQIPVTSKTELSFHDLFAIPFINVKYALLNKRPDDYGITMPTKS